ncbi:MAG: hypothetical protein IKL71_05225 [Bacteroidaceae bacterium]|nr:hypothetical protein [Bacteroidaceae bacterium]
MKKILLSLVTLLCAINVCAQQVVTSINEKKMYTLECKSDALHNTTRFISDTNEGLKGQSSEGTHFRFIRAGETEYYYIQSIVTNKYLSVAAANSGTTVTLETEPTTSWQQSDTYFQPVIDNELQSDLYLNNNTSGDLQIYTGSGLCSQWTLREYDYVGKIDFDDIPSGFYRFKVRDQEQYFAAPTTLPTSNTSGANYKATFVTTKDNTDARRDVWYIENLGTVDGADDGKGKIIYKIWCFQGGYGLSTNPSPDVYGSYANDYCPRLYSIVKTGVEGEDDLYYLGGHLYDNDNVGNNKNCLGLATDKGAIGNTGYLRDNNSNYTSTHRSTGTVIKWEIHAVDKKELTKSVTINEIGVGTFAFTSDVKIPEGVEAYVATTNNDDYIALTRLEETIPARMGVVLRKTEESKTEFDFEAVHGLGIGMSAVNTDDGTLTPVDDKDNLLVGTLAETQLAVGDYILTKKKVDGVATDEVVFGKISTQSNIAANKAYLPAEAVSQTRGFYTLMWDDLETGIEEIGSATVQKDGIFVEGQQIVIVKNGLKYNAKGQRVK